MTPQDDAPTAETGNSGTSAVQDATHPAETGSGGAKLKDAIGGGSSAAAAYFAVTYGPMPRWKAVLFEIVQLFLSGVPGALGYALRGVFYPPFLGGCGRKVLFGRHVTLRHPTKIRLGDKVVLDDRSTLDAKGSDNVGITLGNGVFVGRNSTVYCKNGNVRIRDRASVSANCIVFSSNDLEIGPGTMIGSFSYLLSGGEYDYASPVPYCEQSGTVTRGPLRVGADCWLGAHVTVLDAASIGDGSVVAAGAVVVSPVPPHSLAMGVPARAKKDIPARLPVAADARG